MQMLALEANAVGSWFKAYSLNELALTYVRGRHQTSRELLSSFRSWADDNNLVIEWSEREFYLKLSEFACRPPAATDDDKGASRGKKGGVTVTLTDGTSIECALLVGSDGIFSTVRRQLSLDLASLLRPLLPQWTAAWGSTCRP